MALATERDEVNVEGSVSEGGSNPGQEAAAPDELSELHSPRYALPWIGSLANPHLVPMVVFNDSGYLVPLWTASDLLRGCKYYWRAAQE